MENINKKKQSKKLITLLFSLKMFLKLVSKPILLEYPLIFLKKKKNIYYITIFLTLQ